MCKPADQKHKLARAVAFLKIHKDCGDAVVAALDIAPDVIRIDCLKCHTNIQIPYDA